MNFFKRFSHPVLTLFLCAIFINQSLPSNAAPENLINLPAPGSMLSATPNYVPPVLEGLTIDRNNPLKMDFILNTNQGNLQGDDLTRESMKLIKYFLTGLTVPENQVWVNLSPYEKDRIIEKNFAKTDMGRDMLAEDYILKQLSASLSYPEKSLGKKFWDKIYSQVQLKFGTNQIPMNTFNKIWIVPEKAVVFVHGDTAYVIDSHLKVMMEEDYLALKNNLDNPSFSNDSGKSKIISGETSKIVREVLIPAIEQEVNEGQNFANLRQIYNSMILATWYKKNLRESLLGQVYVNQNKTKGIDGNQASNNQAIYDRYVAAFKKGVYNYIKEDVDAQSKDVTPRKYFSGGTNMAMLTEKLQQVEVGNINELTADQMARVRSIVATSDSRFRVTLVLVENASASDLEKASSLVAPKTGILAQRVTTVRGAKTGETFLGEATKNGAVGIIAGHSEARQNFGDTDDDVNQQLLAALQSGTNNNVLAVGESAAERSSGIHQLVVAAHVRAGIKGMTAEQVANTKFAYEPYWAIQGPNFIRKATAQDAQEMARLIKTTVEDVMRDEYGAKVASEVAGKIKILFGGSVNKDSVAEYLSQRDIDGVLVGTASLSLSEFKGMVEAAIAQGPKGGVVPVVIGNWKTMAPQNTMEEFADYLSTLDPNQVETAIAPSTTTEMKTLSAALTNRELAKARNVIRAANVPTVHFGFEKPKGQAASFFTNVYSIYSLKSLLKGGRLTEIPDAVVNAVRDQLNQDIKDGKILSARVNDYGGDSIDIQVTHNYGELNADVHRLMLDAMRAGLRALKALHGGAFLQGDFDTEMPTADLIKTLNIAQNEHSITERGAESVEIARFVGATPGAANIKLFHQFGMPGSTPLQKLGLGKAPGFRFRVRRTADILNGNVNGPEWEFEISHERTVNGVYIPSKNESIQLLGLLSQPNDYQITGVFPVEGGSLNPNEPIATVVYQMAGNTKITNTAILYRSQSGADAVGGIASIVYYPSLVPGGENGDFFVATSPVTLEEARRAPAKGLASVSVVAYQSRGNGEIPMEAIKDHVALNPDAVSAQRNAAAALAKVFITHENDQPYLSPGAAEEKMAITREAQNPYFQFAPRDNESDPLMADVEARIKAGALVVTTHEKADMGGEAGHTTVPKFMEATYKASLREAVAQGKLHAGSTLNVGDDGHMLMIGDTSDHGEEGHQLAFMYFTRAYLMSSANKVKPYGEGQDYQGPEAQAAKKNPYFYSQFTEEFFTYLREEMAQAYPDHQDFAKKMVDTVYAGWKSWKESGQESTQLNEPFSGNVSQQGIGYARYMVDIADGETTFDVIAGDKMGPPALNRLLRYTVFNAVDQGAFPNGLVFEIWDAKAFDHHGNVPVADIPAEFKDVKDLGIARASAADQEFLKGAYVDGKLRSDLTDADKDRLTGILKTVGFIPTKRIFLDAQADQLAVIRYLADSDRFNVKHVWGKKQPGWDIANPQNYLDRPMLGSSITRLGILTGGEYVGKDDPVIVGNTKLLQFAHEFLANELVIVQGDMNGSHWLSAIPTERRYGVATVDSHPILLGVRNTLSADGKTLEKSEDLFNTPAFDAIRAHAFEFNRQFKNAQLGGQWEPYGTNVRTVEGSYDLAKLLNDLNRGNSPFMVPNIKAKGDVRPWPHNAAESTAALYQAVITGRASADQALLSSRIALANPNNPVDGGIDFGSKFLHLQVERDDAGNPRPMSEQPVAHMLIDGFSPLITRIAPMIVPSLSKNNIKDSTERLSFNK